MNLMKQSDRRIAISVDNGFGDAAQAWQLARNTSRPEC
ncbi:hypothetical protein APS_1930 [Acetobacter pasteurianus subsp. pasteurianus LMG 1262 = NBRC 106471]|nr:hypothetical protein APS_1930 [Acetobacter pasteurianus subsp. pasteurianus LMG 1262 = NBRC 106471]